MPTESSLQKLKSNSSPWERPSTNREDDSEEEDDIISGLSKQQRSKQSNKSIGEGYLFISFIRNTG